MPKKIGAHPLTNERTINNLRFSQWKEKVNAACVKQCGMSADDLPDWEFYGSWECGDTPSQAAKDCIEAAKGY